MCKFKLIQYSLLGLLLTTTCISNVYAGGSDQEILAPCEAIGQQAAKEQLCYQLEKSILTYKELLAICPEDYLSKHQMGISYVLLGQSENGLKYMYEAINDLNSAGNTELAEQLTEATDNWINNAKGITPEAIEKERSAAVSTNECKEFFEDAWESTDK